MSEQSRGSGWWLAADGRWYPPESHPGYRHVPPTDRRLRWLVGFGLGLALVVTLTVAILSDDDGSDGPVGERDLVAELGVDPHEPGLRGILRGSPGGPRLPEATLTAHDEGCGVIRSELPADPGGLTSSINDADGFQVLQRNATNETRYRYFQPGTYTVVLEAWGGDGYVAISNEVTITC